MMQAIKNAPQLFVSESTRFCVDGELRLEQWLDLIAEAHWTNPTTSSLSRFGGVEIVFRAPFDESARHDRVQWIADAIRARTLTVGNVVLESDPANQLDSRDAIKCFERGIALGADAARLLTQFGVRLASRICFDIPASIEVWTGGHMTNLSDALKESVRRILALNAAQHEQFALKLRCNRAVCCSPERIKRFVCTLVNRRGLGVFVDTAELATAIVSPNFGCESYLSDAHRGERSEFAAAYERAASCIGSEVLALNVAQTTLEPVIDRFGAKCGANVQPHHPQGRLDLVNETGLILAQIPNGLRSLGQLTWSCGHTTRAEALDPNTWRDALAVLDNIRQVHGF